MRTHEGQAKTLTEQDFQGVIDSVMETSRHPIRDAALMQISYRAALRVKEIASLTLDDVLAPDGKLLNIITLRKTTTKGKKGGKAFLESPALRSALAEYVKERLCIDTKCRNLFVSQKGTAFSSPSLSRLYTNLYKKAGAYGCTSHTGRRSAASNLIKNGANIYQIKSVLRHENIQTTAVYLEEDDETLAQLMRQV